MCCWPTGIMCRHVCVQLHQHRGPEPEEVWRLPLGVLLQPAVPEAGLGPAQGELRPRHRGHRGGHGPGARGHRDIGAGQLIFKENPVISVTLPRTDCCASCDTMGMKQYGVWMEIQEKVDKLDPENRNKFNRLTRMENMKPRPRNINLEVICTKFYNNAKLVKGSDGRDHRTLFLRLSLGNHSCDPNSRYTSSQ